MRSLGTRRAGNRFAAKISEICTELTLFQA